MRLRKISTVACVFTIAAFLAGSAALAEPGFHRPGMQQMRARLLDQLQLSDTQRADIQNIFANAKESSKRIVFF